MNIQKLMRQAQEMQAKMQAAQQKLGDHKVEASVGGGKVTVVATAAGDVLSIKIAKEVVDPNDVELLEDLVLSAVKQALEEGRKAGAAEMGKISAGLGLPPGMGF